MHTLSVQAQTQTSTIRSTIARIERETDYRAKQNWLRQHPNTRLYALFVAKLDVSEIPIQLHDILPTFEERLAANGYGIYSIDYTRDFSGTLDRQSLVDYLCEEHDFRTQGTFAAAMESSTPTILDNTDSVGNHVCTWISTHNGYTMRTKVYNKIVSNIEAGEIQEQFGGHLADYVDCPNIHLRKTFLHPDTQSRGCTRIEVSLYACTTRTPETADMLVDSVLQMLPPLFVAQPAVRQYTNFAKALDRCFVLADRPNSTIYVCWYAHTKTKRMGGVCISPTKNTVEKDNLWYKAISFAVGDFGFRNCPIFQTEILSTTDGIQLSPLRCYTKNSDTQTILSACRRPTQLHQEAPDPATLLPPTTIVDWTWRQKKCKNAIGVEAPLYKFQEVPTQRSISLLSTRDRVKLQLQMQEEMCVEIWKRSAHDQLLYLQDLHQQNLDQRSKELQQLQEYIQQNEYYASISTAMRGKTDLALRGKTEHISTLASTTTIWSVLGYRQSSNACTSCRVVVQNTEGGLPKCVWANTKLEKLLHAYENHMETTIDKYKRQIHWFSTQCLHIRVLPQTKFLSAEKEILYHPIVVVQAPDQQPQSTQIHEVDEQEYDRVEQEATEYLLETNIPPSKEWTKAIDMQPGQYICRKYATTKFRGKDKTVLFLLPTDDAGMPTTDIDIPVHGFFLEKEIQRIDLGTCLQPMLCRIGEERTTPQHKKDRLFHVVANTENTQIDSKCWTRALDMPPGDYPCIGVTKTTYRKKDKTILHLSMADNRVAYVHGFFVEQVVERFGGVVENKTCAIGNKRYTPTRKEDRDVFLY